MGNLSPCDLLLLGLVAMSAAYSIAALTCATAFRRDAPPRGFCPPVTILKPLCGAEGPLYVNLRSFCVQGYPSYQILFGVRDPGDPAIGVVERLIREFPALDLALVITDRPLGSNPKVANLSGLASRAKHDVIVVADSDIRVAPDYLLAVVAPLADPSVGLVTCLYRGVTGAGWWSRLGAMFINEWFFPSALLGARLGGLRHAFGATISVRRDALAAVGGFETLADCLADDYVLGRLVARRYRVVLAPFVVENVSLEKDCATLCFHELRWTRTFRTARPLAYALAIVTHGIPLTCLLLLVAGPGSLVLIAAAVHVALRCGGRVVLYRVLGLPAPWATTWLIPVRDMLSFALWLLSFLGRSVRWNGEQFRVNADGTMTSRTPRVPEPSALDADLAAPQVRG